jgi:prepilin-type N-terminal cleavage/methylation domain-containing protein
MQDVVGSRNTLSHALRTRHSVAVDQPLPEERREAGFSLIELLVVLAVVMIIGMLAVSQFLTAFDRSRQRSTMGDMRSISAANGSYATDLPDIAPYYLGMIPPVDRWGYGWQYEYGDGEYTLASTGSDGVDGPLPPAVWQNNPFECDLIVQNGAFFQAPTS